MDGQFSYFVIIGFLAQVVDGALGMAYGITATTFLFTLGIPPATASASVHAAEMVTTGVSGLSHLAFRNIDGPLIRRLILPGVLGAVTGAYLLTTLPVGPIKVAVAIYLACMGVLVLRRAWNQRHGDLPRSSPRRIVGIALAGGFFDAMGGGGWGPIVTSSLLAQGGEPRFTVGSVNLAEFFIATAASTTFFLTIGLQHGEIILALIVGGILGAPFGAWICKRLPARILLIIVGLLIVILSLRTIGHLLAGIP
jgi:uncharacterized membrane protein YfcA